VTGPDDTAVDPLAGMYGGFVTEPDAQAGAEQKAAPAVVHDRVAIDILIDSLIEDLDEGDHDRHWLIEVALTAYGSLVQAAKGATAAQWHDALIGERPPVAPIREYQGTTYLWSELVMYARRNGRWVWARWTTTSRESPVSAWFQDGHENPIEYVEGDCWSELPAGFAAKGDGA